MEMLGGATDGLVAREGYQRVFVAGGKGTAWHDLAFGFEAGMEAVDVEKALKEDEAGLPRRVVLGRLGEREEGKRVMEGMGYGVAEVALGVLAKTRMDWEIDGGLQLLPARAVYVDLKALGALRAGDREAGQRVAQGMELMLDEARLDMLILRDASGPVACGAVITVNSMGLIVDFYAKAGASAKAAETMLWYLLELCGRSQHKAVGYAMGPEFEFKKVFEGCGFLSLEGIRVWER